MNPPATTPRRPASTSSLRSLLVHLDDSAPCEARARFARALADVHGSEITAMYVKRLPLLPLDYGFAEAPAVAAAIHEREQRGMSRARDLFVRVLQGQPVAHWAEIEPSDGQAQAFALQGQVSDLVVLGAAPPPQVEERPAWPSHAGWIDDVIVACGRPVLVLPNDEGLRAAPPARPLVAWNATPGAARAVAGALPLLAFAREVDVVTWREPEDDAGAPPGPDLVAWFARHGIAARWQREDLGAQDVAAALAARARDLGTDLLVAGRYGHGRRHEKWFGGVTRALLETVPLPLVLTH
jgi:nucleotide-binding universal stress UspA family protein